MLKFLACLTVLLPIATLIGQPTPPAPLKVLPSTDIVVTDAASLPEKIRVAPSPDRPGRVVNAGFLDQSRR